MPPHPIIPRLMRSLGGGLPSPPRAEAGMRLGTLSAAIVVAVVLRNSRRVKLEGSGFMDSELLRDELMSHRY
jgi:hypothetical protein